MPNPGQPSSERSPFWAALEASAHDLELSLTRFSLAIIGVGLLLSLLVAARVDRELGVPLALLCAAGVGWFAWVERRLRAGDRSPALRWAGPVVEALLPAAVLVVLVRTAGPAYALGSWVPPQLWALFLAASILRLRPALPAMMGAVSAAAYAACWFAVIRPAVGPGADLLHTTDMQVVRVLTLALMGFAGSAAVIWLRGEVGRAGRRVRSLDLFGKYRLGDEIASGGMGTVLHATYCPEGGFERQVAIKRIHPHLAGDPAFLDRFRDEARLCARLAHPNIVAALDFGQVDDTWFFAMEYVDGPTLHEVLELRRETGAPLDEALVAHVVREIAEGLHHAHAVARDEDGRVLRVVHRDLSPTNVLLDRTGRVRISDFGVARALKGAHDVLTPTMTGKPAYMAPELLRQEAYDERADLFALGVVTWEMLCNQRLFARDERHATMAAVLDAPIPAPSEIRSDTNPAWDAFFARALARDPARRFPSATELSEALAAVQLHVGTVGNEELAAVVCAIEDVPVLELDSTTDMLAHSVAADG